MVLQDLVSGTMCIRIYRVSGIMWIRIYCVSGIMWIRIYRVSGIMWIRIYRVSGIMWIRLFLRLWKKIYCASRISISQLEFILLNFYG